MWARWVAHFHNLSKFYDFFDLIFCMKNYKNWIFKNRISQWVTELLRYSIALLLLNLWNNILYVNYNNTNCKCFLPHKFWCNLDSSIEFSCETEGRHLFSRAKMASSSRNLFDMLPYRRQHLAEALLRGAATQWQEELEAIFARENRCLPLVSHENSAIIKVTSEFVWQKTFALAISMSNAKNN